MELIWGWRRFESAYHSAMSCLTNLLDFLEEVHDNLDEDKAVDIIYLDYAKAFDKVLKYTPYKSNKTDVHLT